MACFNVLSPNCFIFIFHSLLKHYRLHRPAPIPRMHKSSSTTPSKPQHIYVHIPIISAVFLLSVFQLHILRHTLFSSAHFSRSSCFRLSCVSYLSLALILIHHVRLLFLVFLVLFSPPTCSNSSVFRFPSPVSCQPRVSPFAIFAAQPR